MAQHQKTVAFALQPFSSNDRVCALRISDSTPNALTLHHSENPRLKLSIKVLEGRDVLDCMPVNQDFSRILRRGDKTYFSETYGGHLKPTSGFHDHDFAYNKDNGANPLPLTVASTLPSMPANHKPTLGLNDHDFAYKDRFLNGANPPPLTGPSTLPSMPANHSSHLHPPPVIQSTQQPVQMQASSQPLAVTPPTLLPVSPQEVILHIRSADVY